MFRRFSESCVDNGTGATGSVSARAVFARVGKPPGTPFFRRAGLRHEPPRDDELHGRYRTFGRSVDAAPRKGVTLLELLTAMAIMVMVVGALGGITRAIQLGFEYNQGHGEATQHARVVLERITRMAREATANETFPGFIVAADEVSTWRFPETLVIWHPDAEPVAPGGLPRLNELVIYCPHPDAPGTLVEITTSDTAELSADEVARASQIQAIKDSSASRVTTLTTLLRTGSVDNAGEGELRGAVRFEVLLRPSDAQWADAAIAWEDLPWVQGIYGSQTGLRQAWVRMELQLMTSGSPGADGVDRRQAIPFLGSAALYYTLNKDQRP